MKRELLIGVTAMTLLAGGQAFSQSVAVELTPAQRTTIKEYVVKEKVRPFAMKERVSVGATLPGEVVLVPVPSVWGPSLTQYHYVYSDDRVMLVEPSSRRVIQVID